MFAWFNCEYVRDKTLVLYVTVLSEIAVNCI